MDSRIRQHIEEVFSSPVQQQKSLSGGCLGQLSLLMLENGQEVVLKQGAGLECEAFMLRYLRDRTALPVPELFLVEKDFILMEYLPGCPGPSDRMAQRHLAELVAMLHDIGQERFGFARDTVIGPLRQPNGQTVDWLTFFRERRLKYMAEEARAAGKLPEAVHRRLMDFADRLELYLGHVPRPSLLHGDLWGGNILSQDGRITGVVDPALYFGDAEIELAFMTLFGTVDRYFFETYQALRPLDQEFFDSRREIYLLYPLLVHVRLFGGSYVGQVSAILDRLGE
ncbi:fructosamine kinase family protein [Luteithermobacter gelatinilyticus]|uniref:fructosamine kinase family protein n=1 Tax=Luteithermobacter gelatinilyticus TaxID=2582913 RepID=UPI001105B0F5|nr:fructosamine kinase family protein [Luteithermobacter gelatinilyticus]